MRNRVLSYFFVQNSLGFAWSILPSFVRQRLPINSVAIGFFKTGIFRWRLHPGELIGRKYFSFGFRKYQPSTQAYLKDFYNNRKDKEITFLNIGANVGIWPLLISMKHQRTRFLLVEPLPQNLQLLETNLQMNHIFNFEIFNFAAGKENKSLIIYQNNNLLGISSAHVKTDIPVYVQVRRIDQIIHEKIDLILIDVEGFELEVMEGLSSLVKKYLPPVIVEASEETLGQLKQLMSNLGYASGVWLSKEQEYKEQNKDFLFQALDAL
jgi:FkbM family methyltransferase